MPIVLTNAQFTGANDTKLQAHDADWVRLHTPDASLEIQSNFLNSEVFYEPLMYVWDGTGSPTGDQRIQANLYAYYSNDYDTPFLFVRAYADGGGIHGYAIGVRSTGFAPLAYRIHNGTWTLLTTGWTGDITAAVFTKCEARCITTGGNPVIGLNINDAGWQTYEDTNVAKILTGQPGIGTMGVQSALWTAGFDAVTIEDLGAAELDVAASGSDVTAEGGTATYYTPSATVRHLYGWAPA
jgi:hypothetical protein